MDISIGLDRYAEGLGYLSMDLQTKLAQLRDLNNKVHLLMKHADQLTEEYLKGNFSSEAKKIEQKAYIDNLFAMARGYSNDKVALSNEAYNLIDKHVNRLDFYLMRFKKEIKIRAELIRNAPDHHSEERRLKRDKKAAQERERQKKRNGKRNGETAALTDTSSTLKDNNAAIENQLNNIHITSDDSQLNNINIYNNNINNVTDEERLRIHLIFDTNLSTSERRYDEVNVTNSIDQMKIGGCSKYTSVTKLGSSNHRSGSNHRSNKNKLANSQDRKLNSSYDLNSKKARTAYSDSKNSNNNNNKKQFNEIKANIFPHNSSSSTQKSCSQKKPSSTHDLNNKKPCNSHRNTDFGHSSRHSSQNKIDSNKRDHNQITSMITSHQNCTSSKHEIDKRKASNKHSKDHKKSSSSNMKPISEHKKSSSINSSRDEKDSKRSKNSSKNQKKFSSDNSVNYNKFIDLDRCIYKNDSIRRSNTYNSEQNLLSKSRCQNHDKNTEKRKPDEKSMRSDEDYSKEGKKKSKILETNKKDEYNIPPEPDEPTYCFCQKVSYGDMVACDDVNCKFEWFHFGCVGLTRSPPGTWFCSDCAKKQTHEIRKSN